MSAANNSSLRRAYEHAFTNFLDQGDENALRSAYELGRSSVAQGVGLLDLALIHHEVLVAQLEQPDANGPQVAHAAAEFLLEALSAFEMITRGFGEAVDAVSAERRQAAMLRQLSTLLTDRSLAVQSRSSLEEMLRLVSEQVRELTRANCALAQADFPPHDFISVIASSSSDAADPPPLPRRAIATLSDSPGEARWLQPNTPDLPESMLAAPLSALDGHLIGVLAIGSHPGTHFSELDEAILVHLAQMAAATLERSSRYG